MNEDMKTAAAVLAVTLIISIPLAKKRLCVAMRWALWSLAAGLGSLFFEWMIPAILGGLGCLVLSACAYVIAHQTNEPTDSNLKGPHHAN